jgi:cell fate (sporulation/competence/biofilm development) regulator YlbF (YheA/YmcA/DUF963 family)
MSANIYDIAYDLEKAIRQSDDFQNLKKMYEEIQCDESAGRMLNNFRNIQLQLHQKQMTGAEILPEEIEQAQKVAALVQQHEKIAKLMELEQRMSFLIAEVNKIAMKPLEELYSQFE